MSSMTHPIIRRATEADLPAINDIFYQNEIAGEPPDSPNIPAPRPLAGFAHLHATADLHVAEVDGLLLGFTSRMVRGPVAYLSDLFVLPDYQSSGIGRQLLAAGFPDDVAVRCTMSSTDPRAHTLYTRLGMIPQWPNYWLLLDAERLGTLPASDIQLLETDASDDEWHAWDTALCGRPRPQEYSYWLEYCQAFFCWFERAGKRVGYGMVQRISDGSYYHPDAYTLGPIGAYTPDDAATCVLATVEWARHHTSTIRLAVPGLHPALKPLLDARAEITYIETFHSSATAPSFEPRLYLPPGDLF